MLVNDNLRQRVINIKRLQKMTLIHAGYSELIPAAVVNQVSKPNPEACVGAFKDERKLKFTLTDEMKEEMQSTAIQLVLEGRSHVEIYEDLISLGMLNSCPASRPGYVTISRWITVLKRSMNIDIRPLYLKVGDRLEQGANNEEIAQALGITVDKVKRARSKLRCVEKRDRLKGEAND